jgi:hypothetical protein
MQTFSFLTPNMGLGGNKKSTFVRAEFIPIRAIGLATFSDLMRGVDYVFVDEHNRHKRLKGMYSVISQSHRCLADGF